MGLQVKTTLNLIIYFPLIYLYKEECVVIPTLILSNRVYGQIPRKISKYQNEFRHYFFLPKTKDQVKPDGVSKKD